MEDISKEKLSGRSNLPLKFVIPECVQAELDMAIASGKFKGAVSQESLDCLKKAIDHKTGVKL